MKIWRFYKNPGKDFDKKFPDIEYDVDDIRLKYPLLAITNKKKLAEEYMYTRKKENFICKCESGYKDEILDYMKSNRGYVLGYHDIRRFKYKRIDPSKYTLDEITYKLKVLMTENEELYLEELLDTGAILEMIFKNYLTITPLIFNDKFKKLLKQVGYIDCYSLYHEDMSVYKGYGDLGEYYPNIDFMLDEFYMFIYINRENLNIENFLKLLQ